MLLLLSTTKIPATVVAAIVAGGVALVSLAINGWVAGQRDLRNRRRDVYASAFAAVMAYVEFPYVVRRRRAGPPEVAADERVRISEELREVQEQLAYYSAWITTESAQVAIAFNHLVAETRRIAGRQIHEAWGIDAITTDQGMNVPDLGLGDLASAKEVYLREVTRHLRWLGR